MDKTLPATVFLYLSFMLLSANAKEGGKSRQISPMDDETYKTIFSLCEGSFDVPVKERTKSVKSACVRFWRNQESYSIKKQNGKKVLFYKEKPICEFFVVSKILLPVCGEDIEEEKKLLITLSDNRSFWVNLSDVGSGEFYRRFSEFAILPSYYFPRVQEYLMLFEVLNYSKIPKETLVTRVGWIEDTYYLPQTVTDVNFVDKKENLAGYGISGSREKEYRVVKEIVENEPAGILWFVGLLAPLMKLFKYNTGIFFTYGTSGLGKTLSNLLALSLYGSFKELFETVDGTKVGDELLFDSRKDTPVLLDEIDTAGKEVRKKIDELIYHFASGRGRRRSNKRLEMRKKATYRGLLLLTSERSLLSIITNSQDELKQGVFRRTVQIPVDRIEKVCGTYLSKNSQNLILYQYRLKIILI